jgi:hypothetical protein
MTTPPDPLRLGDLDPESDTPLLLIITSLSSRAREATISQKTPFLT